ncbi:DUF4625 domain-containing protein [Litoribacter ruber]|uniref:DUF4625 domain-containing protein n=1 Tax=Litoribacter ruber TaxID=702568 RepID=UPI001FE3A22A|nr:DUF4625 domain-containing protein [Litoribacter alkaliphilus]
MIKKYLLLSAMAGVVFFSCNTDDDTPRDMDAPVISTAEGRDEIRPRQGERMAATNDHMHVRFSVSDPSGIQQVRIDVHSGFDGHTHGRVAQGFEPLTVSRRIDLNGATFYNQDGHDTDIYWEGENSEIDGTVLAGPYHFGIDATDIHGNVTSYADNNNYSSTFYLERPYAPDMQITNLDGNELDGEPGEALDVQGTVHRRDHQLSSDITFLWVRLVEEDDHDDDDHGHGEDVYERMWGQSTWRQHSNGNWYGGADLPSGASINLAEALAGDNAIILPSGDRHYELIIWAEDSNGNVTRRAYEVHAH